MAEPVIPFVKCLIAWSDVISPFDTPAVTSYKLLINPIGEYSTEFLAIFIGVLAKGIIAFFKSCPAIPPLLKALIFWANWEYWWNTSSWASIIEYSLALLSILWVCDWFNILPLESVKV